MICPHTHTLSKHTHTHIHTDTLNTKGQYEANLLSAEWLPLTNYPRYTSQHYITPYPLSPDTVYIQFIISMTVQLDALIYTHNNRLGLSGINFYNWCCKIEMEHLTFGCCFRFPSTWGYGTAMDRHALIDRLLFWGNVRVAYNLQKQWHKVCDILLKNTFFPFYKP